LGWIVGHDGGSFGGEVHKDDAANITVILLYNIICQGKNALIFPYKTLTVVMHLFGAWCIKTDVAKTA